MYIHYLFSIEDTQSILDTINDNGEKIVTSFSLPDQGQACIICEAKPETLEDAAKLTSVDRLARILKRPTPGVVT